VLLRKEHGMSPRSSVRPVLDDVVGIWLEFFQLLIAKKYVLFATLIDAEPTDIERALFRHQRRIIWQIVLDASDQ